MNQRVTSLRITNSLLEKLVLVFILVNVSCITKITTVSACEDANDSFDVILPDGTVIQKKCKQVAKNPWRQCAKDEILLNCPVTCRACPDDVRCRVKADLQFPQGPELVGHHRASVQIEKTGEDRVCFSGDPKTNWGCTQVIISPLASKAPTGYGGDAFIIGENGFFNKRHASARIYDGRNGKFTVGVSHIFTEEEVLEEPPDFHKRANLIIKVNGVAHTQSFRHGKNKIKPTHLGYDIVNSNNENVGFINPEYNGDFFVDIDCDNECNCEIVKRKEVCKLKAQLKFTDIAEEFGQQTET